MPAFTLIVVLFPTLGSTYQNTTYKLTLNVLYPNDQRMLPYNFKLSFIWKNSK